MFNALEKSSLIANLKLLDCSFRLLVQLLPGRCLLAVHLQGPSDLLAADDHLQHYQPDPYWNWIDNRMLLSTSLWRTLLLTLLTVWYGSLGVWKGDSR